ncbi:MAG: hypothetical protein ACPHQ9_07055 [Marinobacter sp.]|uniref:hypothetical protein n=1 Tax=Marinobacter sp. TaxID=50741 RepID=UPI003C5E5C17
MSENAPTMDRILHEILSEEAGNRFELIRIRNQYTNSISENVRPSKKDLWWYVYTEMEKLRSHGLVRTLERSDSCEGKVYEISQHFGECPISIVPEPFHQPVHKPLEMKRIEDLKYKIEVYRRTTQMLIGSIKETQDLADELPPLAKTFEKKAALLNAKYLELSGRIGAIRSILDELIDT